MDPIDILGSLLGGGKSSGGGGLGGKILTDLLNGRRRTPPPAQPPAAPQPRSDSSSGRGPSRQQSSLEQQAHELEDLLGVANDRRGGRTQTPAPVSPSVTRPTRPPDFDDVGARYRPAEPHRQVDRSPRRPQETMNQDDEVIVLIRAMINAAKADGRVTQQEQQAVLSRISNPSREKQQFLQDEFAKPVDVRQFAWSVPLGLEQKVYMLSLAAIDLDTNPEASYLRDLAHGLRLPPETCNQIHQQLGAPTLF